MSGQVVAMPGVAVSLDFDIVTPEGYEEARQAWGDGNTAKKGGEGSGFHGHAGRPGQVGGSQASGISWYTGKVGGYKVYPSLENYPEADAVRDTYAEVKKTVPSLPDVKYVIGHSPLYVPAANGKEAYGPFGLSTRTEDKQPLIVIDMPHLDDRLPDLIEDADNTKRWFQVSEVTRESMRTHVIAHELGHVWWNAHAKFSVELVRNPDGSAGRVETNPTLVDWKAIVYPQNKYKFSDYAVYNDSPTEAFADSFAAFVTGENMDPAIEAWFLENVK